MIATPRKYTWNGIHSLINRRHNRHEFHVHKQYPIFIINGIRYTPASGAGTGSGIHIQNIILDLYSKIWIFLKEFPEEMKFFHQYKPTRFK